MKEAIARAIANPDAGLLYLDKLDAEASLMSFIRLMWPVLEPGRKLVEGWALYAIIDHLEAMARGDILKLLINVPPGCMKSLTTGVFFPAWIWGPLNMPHKRFCSWSYGQDLTVRDNRKMRLLIESDMYRTLWGDQFKLTSDQNEKKFFENDATGFMFASGIGGAGTGHRGDFCRFDDPHKVKEAESEVKREDANQWIAETLPTRKNDDKCAFLGIMQRIHQHDASGMIIDEELGYEHLCLPMEFEADHPHPSKTSLDFVDPRTEDGELLWPERFSREEVDDLKKGLSAWGGSYAVAGQFQQRPAPRGGGMFQQADFKYVDDCPTDVSSRVRGWDLAATSKRENPRASHTVGLRMSKDKEGRIYIEDVRRIQGSDLEVEQLLRQCAEMDSRRVVQDIPQDPGQAGKAQKAALARLLHGYECKFSPETGKKQHRAIPLSAQCEAGNLYLVRGSWNAAFVREACIFPAGDKDQIDAASRAYARLIMKKPRRIGSAPRVIGND